MTHLLEVLTPYTPYLALVLRVWLGATLMIHGRPKLNKQNREKSIANMAGKGVPAGAVLMGAIIEFFGGLFLVIGFIVPFTGAVVAIYFANIVAVKKAKDKAVYIGYGKPNFELEVFFAMVGVVLVFLGAGVLSLDGLLGL